MNQIEYIYNTLKDMIVGLEYDRSQLEKYLIVSDNSRDVSRMFVRDTKLSLCNLIQFMIMPRGASSQSELMTFYDGIGIEAPTKSAFSIKRKLISYKLFPFLNAELLDRFYRSPLPKRWRGKYIIAVDGTTLTMPRGSRFEALYGYAALAQNRSVRVPTARAIVLSDVLNHQILDIRLNDFNSYEAEMAYETIKALPDYIRDNAVFLFDRGFLSSWFVTVLQNMNIQYVIRCRHNTSNAIDEFWDNRLKHQDIQIAISRAAWSTKTRARYEKNGITPERTRPVFIHLTKSRLPGGENEVICSQVFGAELSAAQSYRMYGLRWEIETAIGIEKNELQIEIFSGYSKNAILQDIYCKVISYNLCSIAAMVANKKLKVKHNREVSSGKNNNAKTPRAHPVKLRRYKVNMDMVLFNFRELVIQMVRNRTRLHVLIGRFIRDICRYYEPVEKNRKIPRKFRAYKTHGKYATYTNYARVI